MRSRTFTSSDAMPTDPFSLEAAYYDVFRGVRDYYLEARRLVERFPLAETVLEIGAGTGRLTHELVQRGLQVTCVEPSVNMRARLRERLRCGSSVPIYNCRIQDFVFPHRFDLIVAHYDVLNYVPPPEFNRVMSHLRHYGRHLSIELWDPSRGVRPWDYRRVQDCSRVRVAWRRGRRVEVRYLYWGRGRVYSRHQLWLHDLPQECRP